MSSNHKYFSSGDLEAYVLGLLSEAEASEVERAIASDKELQKEVAEIEASLLNYARAHAVTPPAYLKAKVFKHLREKGVGYSDDQSKSDENETITRSLVPRWMFYAASVTLLLSMGVNIVLFRNNAGLKEQYKEVQFAYERLVIEQQKLVYSASQTEDKLQHIVRATTISVPLQSQEGFAEMSARVYWDVRSGKTLFHPQKMPPLPDEKTYQLWIIADGAPRSVGVFDSESELIIDMEGNVFAADAFAVSIEPKGGSELPTPDQICMVGVTQG